ncbi:hypothetical protein [Paenibacillus jilunlii]|uniref:Helicase ATP-binding domain-containing protein n=1 Tax=Paenibacillus jilunlii TaxID=682956 RepID=A0A1G9JAX3_9BACL|nr:hypothetical protein [Paenibacillus jilunlii]KWX74832.1 hypothetical protein AML91_14420 [Paenibacillus jilunlii]SDL34757.1 hypothetical protein SAMN05216191_102409 [Paenibacillus jilunlii]
MNIRLMLDTEKFTAKPTKDQAGKIVNRITQHQASVTLELLAQAITEGRTHTPATFQPPYGTYGAARKNNECWSSQQIFELDFDEGLSVQQFMLLCNEYSIQPSIVYHTFSSSPEQEKFRVIFTLEQPVTDYRTRGVIQIALMRLFPQCDSVCSDAARHFYGGPDIVVFNNEARLDIQTLIQGYCFAEDNNGNATRNIRSFCQQTGLNMVNGLPAIAFGPTEKMTETPPTLLLYNYRAGDKNVILEFSVSEAEMRSSVKTGKRQPKYNIEQIKTKVRTNVRRRFDFDSLYERCPLYQELLDGNRRLSHPERFGITTNLVNVEGGESRFAQGLSSREDYHIEKGLYEFRYAARQGYSPMACESFCPYSGTCSHKNVMLQQTDCKRCETRRVSTSLDKSLEDAEFELMDAFEKAKTSETGLVHVIKAPTGIGKTKLYTECDLENTMIVVPTHKLREEVAQKLLENGVKFCNVIERPQLDDQEKERLIQSYTKIGAYHEAGKVFQGYVFQAKLMQGKRQPLSACQQQAILYQEAVDQIHNGTAQTILCTHDRLPYIRTKNISTVIVDEDIMRTAVMKSGRAYMNDFQHFLSYILISNELTSTQKTTLSQQFQAVIKDLENATPHRVTPVGTYSFDTKLIAKVIKNHSDSLQSNMLEFLQSNCNFIKSADGKSFDYRVKRADTVFSKDKNFIVLSATCSEYLYSVLLKERLRFHDIGIVEHKGKIEQYIKNGYSRASIKKNPEKAFAEISEKVGSLPTFFYKGATVTEEYVKLAQKYNINVVGYFGNTAGYDGFKGQDIAVVGTPHVTNNEYLLTAACLGYMAGLSDQTAQYRLTERNGYEFWFNTFENELIREIQLWEIETELIQAVGRARAIRENCSVLILSNYPIPGARIKELGEEV